MDWRDRAACREFDPELFFPLTNVGPSAWQAERAIAVCGSCLVNSQCLDWAVSNDVTHGIWGGKTETERADARRSHALQDANVISHNAHAV